MRPGIARRCALFCCLQLLAAGPSWAQSFGIHSLDFAGLGAISSGTSIDFGPDGRLYVLQLNGTLDVFRILRRGPGDYVVIQAEEITAIKDIPNHDDDGSPSGGSHREATGITVVGTATHPVVYATSSDSRIGGPSGDKDLDTNSGVITRLAWQGSDVDDPQGSWQVVDMVRGLPRSEENHATNGLEFVQIDGRDYLIVCSGGHTNAGSPSTNFAWHTEYALSAAVLAVDLTELESMPILSDGARSYVYDLPTVDDPTRANANGIDDPGAMGYDGVDQNDPWGGNDGLNQAKLVVGGPVQIFSPGYRNTYDLVVTESGGVYVTDNGANSGWGGYPVNEGLAGDTTNDYRVGEPGSTGQDPEHGDPKVNNQDHLHCITTDITSYAFGSYYGGHPAPIRANPLSAGLFTRGAHSSDPNDLNGNGFTDDWFRTLPYDLAGSAEASNPSQALPADWPPVPPALANPIEGDYRNPGGSNPDGPVDDVLSTWANNSNAIAEYTAGNFGGAMQGNLIAGRNNGSLHRVELNPDGSLAQLTQNWVSGLGGNALGLTTVGDSGPFPGTIWVAPFNAQILILEPQDFVDCVLPGEPGYAADADNDSDGYSNQDELDNGTDLCNGGSQPGDFDKLAGPPLVSDLNDPDDDADGLSDALDPLQIGDPTSGGSDAFALPVLNELFSDNPELGGYLGLGFTGLMNNGAVNPNWLDWLDQTDAGPNPNDILGGAVGAMTMQMTEGSAYGSLNSQEKGFQYGIQVDLATGGFTVRARLLNFQAGLQLYPFAGDGELGIAMGDGSQSDYIQLVVHPGGIELLQEVGDVPGLPLEASIAVADRPSSSLELELRVDSASGEVEGWFGIDGGPLGQVGTLVAEGDVLAGIQQASAPLVVGLIGSSNRPGAEVEGTWDYLHVVGRQPSAAAPLPDLSETVGASPVEIDLDAFFDDDGGVANLGYSVEAVTNPAFGAALNGSLLTLTFPTGVANGLITIRATDAEGYFVEQSFAVETTDPVAVYRLNAGGPQLAALDGGIPWEQDTTGSNSAYLAIPGGNKQAGFDVGTFSSAVDLTTTPAQLYQTERWSSDPGSPSMRYAFPVPEPGSYQVRLYMGNGWSGANDPGERVFSVTLEGVAYPDLSDLDLSATFGHQVGSVIVHDVAVSDGLLEIDFFHGSANNPMLNGIEIVSGLGGGPAQIPIQVGPIADPTHAEGETVNLPVLASGGDSSGSFQFSALGLPPGVQIEPTTGLLFGTIEAGASAGSPYAVSVSVDDFDADSGDAQSIVFVWTVPDPDAKSWIDKNEDEGYTARHECSFVQAGDRFYLFGGRENPQTLDTYDYAADSWTTSASAPLPFNHFQATEYQGLIWVIGAFQTNAFPNEQPAEGIWAYDPALDLWLQGPSIPVARRRGSAGLVVYGGDFYVVGGNTIGHSGGYVPWLDRFDPETGSWTPLADAPRARDHFHAAVMGDLLYVAGGRLSGGPGGTFAPLIPEVDVYDFTTGLWSTLPAASDLPTPRAASAVAVFDGELLVIGGEGNGQAYATVEALDPLSLLWRSLAPLNFARHGTQAIVSGAGVYVTAGSPSQGGGNQKNMEVYDTDAPSGTPSVAATLSLPSQATLAAGVPEPIALSHGGGNVGIWLESVALSGADAVDFHLAETPSTPVLIPVSEQLQLSVEYVGSAPSAEASLTVEHGGGQQASVQLHALPEPSGALGLFSGIFALLGLRRWREGPRPRGRRPA